MKLETPNKWQQIPLEQLLEFVTGGDWGKEENFPDADYALAYCIRGSEIRNWETEKGSTASLRKIKKTSIESRKLKEGDILVEISGGGPEQPVGRTVLIDKTALNFQPHIPKICTNFLRLMRPVKEVDSKYLYLFLKLFYASGDIVNYQGGSNNLRNLKFPEFVTIKIPVPPLHEQQVIVSKIEELISDLENGKRQLEIAQRQLKIYRQSLLKWAFDGRLTNEKTIEAVSLGKVIEQPKYGTSKKCDYQTKGKGVLRIPNIANGFVDATDLKFAAFEKEEGGTYSLKEGDLLTIRSNGSVDLVGRCALITKKETDFLFAGYLIRLRPQAEKILPKFLLWVLSSHNLRIQIAAKAKSTSGVNNINSEELKGLQIPLPSIEQQEIIVLELESKLTICDKIEETLLQSLKQAETLKSSILKKAFEGKLVVASEVKITKQKEAKVIPLTSLAFPKTIAGIAATDLQAGIISMVIDLHQNNPKHVDKLNHVKCEKISDLVERKLGISLGRVAMKDAAGPDDYPHLKKVEHRANKAGIFRTVALQPIGHTYKPMRKMQDAIAKTKSVLSAEELKQIDDLLKAFLPFKLEHAELVATLFAGWNNLLLSGQTPTDEQIVFESRENWSKRKLTIPKEDFFKTLNWMKQHNYIPEGKGQLVLKKEEVKKAKTSKKKTAKAK